METKPEFDCIREDVEAKQRAIAWPDTLNAGRSIDEFLWKGDPKAKPVQRIGLAIFAFGFLVCAGISIVLLIAMDDWATRILCIALGSFSLVVGLRLSRNVFLRPTSRSARRGGKHGG